MAQIIKHRRGTAAQLKTTTLYKGELGVSTGSVAGVTTPVLHVGDGTNAAGFVVGRLFQGSTVPTLNSGDIGASLNDMLFHDSATYKLYRLNSSGNENLDLTGNIADRVITGSLTIGTAAAPNELLHVYGDISSSGNIHAVGNITFEGGSSGTIELGSDAGDNVVLKADVSSSIIPNNDDEKSPIVQAANIAEAAKNRCLKHSFFGEFLWNVVIFLLQCSHTLVLGMTVW